MEICIKYSEHSIINPIIENVCEIADIDNLQNIYNTIYVGDLANFLDVNDIIPVFHKLKSKLLYSGKICIEQFDLHELSCALVRGKLTSAEFNNIIKPRKQLFTIPDILSLSQHLHLRVLSKDIDNYKHYIELLYV